jgi:hypothetical protein
MQEENILLTLRMNRESYENKKKQQRVEALRALSHFFQGDRSRLRTLGLYLRLLCRVIDP